MASYRWTPRAVRGLAAAIDYTEKNHHPSWVQNLKDAVMALEDAIEEGALIPKRKGRVDDTNEIELTPLPYFFAVKIDNNGNYAFLAFLHKRRKYP